MTDPKSPDPVHLNLNEIVRTYLTNCLAECPKKEIDTTPAIKRIGIGTFNDDLEWLAKSSNSEANRVSIESLEKIISGNPSEFFLILDFATIFENSYRVGLCIGYLFPEVELKQDKVSGSADFRNGVKHGQIYALKSKANPANVLKYAALAVVTVFAAQRLRTEPFHIDNEIAAQTMQFLTNKSLYLGLLCSAYGMLSNVMAGLWGNDPNVSQKLVTGGPFKFHRNPFYASLMGMQILLSAPQIIGNLTSTNPNHLQSLAMVGAFAALYFGLDSYTKKDEKILEKTFGAEYVAYKATTPRYFPAIWKLFK